MYVKSTQHKFNKIYYVVGASFDNTDVEGAGRGAIALEDLKVGDTALEIPASLIIYEKLVHESDMVFLLPKTLI